MSIQPNFIVQDGFGVVHRAHASTEGISHLVPAVAGLLLEAEVTLNHSHSPPPPTFGGSAWWAKISDKLPLVERFLDEADTILIGGAMANNFLLSEKTAIGKSVYEPDQEKEVLKIMERAKPGQLILPADVATAPEIDEDAPRESCALSAVDPSDYILDIGFETAVPQSSCEPVQLFGTVHLDLPKIPHSHKAPMLLPRV